jgi:hypothetical protein
VALFFDVFGEDSKPRKKRRFFDFLMRAGRDRKWPPGSVKNKGKKKDFRKNSIPLAER